MSIKKYTNNAWVDIPYKKYETATDTITSLPKTIIGDGQPISAYTIKGNMVQSGTPTPSNPVYPQEVGDLVTTGEHAGQYEIPISFNGVTYPVYLGNVQTTRQIVKLELTGEEQWSMAGTGASIYYQLKIGSLNSIVTGVSLSSHFQNAQISTSTTDVGVRVYNSSSSNLAALNIRPENVSTDYNTVAKFKQWLADQNTAGTPVVVYYVKTTATTGTVNEPLRKLDEYSDELTSTQAGITIPTTGTAESFDVSTTLKPSEVSLTWHGWHEHTDTKYSNP